jgi:hypothetical protein
LVIIVPLAPTRDAAAGTAPPRGVARGVDAGRDETRDGRDAIAPRHATTVVIARERRGSLMRSRCVVNSTTDMKGVSAW